MLLSQLFVSVTLLTAKGLSPLLADALQPDDPVRLAGADALRSFEASLVDGGEDLQGGISDPTEWHSFSGLPLTGAIRTDGGSRAMVFSSAAENDERDGNSCYASTTSQTEKGTVFLFDVEDDGLLLQVVSARASMPAGLGMFLAVHRQYPADSMYDQALRLIVHADQDRAAIFEVVENDGKQYLRVKAQRASSAPGVVGAYLTVPDNSERDQYSNYLAVTADFDKAMPVTVEPA